MPKDGQQRPIDLSGGGTPVDPTDATHVDAVTVPLVEAGAGSPGVSLLASPADHVHPAAAASGVTSIQSDADPLLTGAIQLVSGAGVTLTQAGQVITFGSSIITGVVVTKVFADSPYTALATDWLIKVDATGGPVTINLPTAVGITGKQYIVKKIDTSGNVVTIDPSGAQTIDGVATVGLSTQWDFVVLASDGANWMIVG